jgi:hypothetical protein
MVTRNARVSDLAIAKVRRFCDQRVPAEARAEVCLGGYNSGRLHHDR